MKAYAGIGSRKTPSNILQEMVAIGHVAGEEGLTLRSGGAEGADTAFEFGADEVSGSKEIFLPWKGFNKNTSLLFDVPEKALNLAATIHPRFQYMRRPAKLLIARNMQQILGTDLETPVEFVVCWTPDGCESHKTYGNKTGGTGSAIALASKNGIPVYNLFNEGRLIAAVEHLDQLSS